MRPNVRDDLALVEGYHSPQVDVEVRLNTNESPLAPPQGFVDEVAAAVSALDWNRYPDREATELRTAIGAGYGLDADRVFAANGSNEVLQAALLAFGGPGRRALVFEPTYALHSHIAKITGTEVLAAERDEDFTLDVDRACELIDESAPEIVFLCSPNNPSGTVDPPDTVATVLDAAERHPTLVIVDEAYGQFAPTSAVDLIADDRSILVTRTFSKTWAMAAARLGYGLASPSIIGALGSVALPYHLDAAKQVTGVVALGYRDDMNRRIAAVVEQRGRVVAALDELDVDVWPSGANFVLFRPRSADGQQVWQALVDRSVLIRNCATWPGLDGCLRVTIGTEDENDRFLQALGEIL